MGFLKDAARGEGQTVNHKRMAEEVYERLVPKMGRDFVSRRDFFEVIERILEIVDPQGFHAVNYQTDAGARSLALEYKGILDSGADGSKIYKDLINLDEDDE